MAAVFVLVMTAPLEESDDVYDMEEAEAKISNVLLKAIKKILRRPDRAFALLTNAIDEGEQ